MGAYRLLERESASPDTIVIYAAPWYGVLRLGSWFKYTDPTLGQVEQLYVVIERAWAGKQWRLIAEINTKPIMQKRLA